MHLLPGNPSSHAVEAYRDSGEALRSKPPAASALPAPASRRAIGIASPARAEFNLSRTRNQHGRMHMTGHVGGYCS